MPKGPWSRRGSLKLRLASWTVLVIVSLLLETRGNSASPSEPLRVVGTITYDGPLPDPIPIAEAGTVRKLVEVDPKTRGLKDAVVWLEGVHEPAGAHQKLTDEPVVMDQQNYFFVPHVLAVEAGRQV